MPSHDFYPACNSCKLLCCSIYLCYPLVQCFGICASSLCHKAPRGSLPSLEPGRVLALSAQISNAIFALWPTKARRQTTSLPRYNLPLSAYLASAWHLRRNVRLLTNDHQHPKLLLPPHQCSHKQPFSLGPQNIPPGYHLDQESG